MRTHGKFCPICISRKAGSLQDVPSYNYCPVCHTAWLKIIPKIKYRENYYTGGWETASAVFNVIENFFFVLRQHYAGKGPWKTWVDVGAGDGNFLKSVNARQRIGVEVSRECRKKMESLGLKTMTGEEFIKSKTLNADVISFWHVLEHIRDPQRYLMGARRNLSQGGKIIIGVPNLDSWEFKRFGKHWFHLAPQYHIWHFSPLSLGKMLNDAGFKIEKIGYCSLEHHFAGVLQSLINRCSKTENVLHKLIKRGVGSQGISFRGLTWSVIWTTIGLPVVLTIWAVNTLSHRSGAFVVVASKKSEN